MEELRHLDEVAYVRFASVYRSFQDIDAFREEIERLRRHQRNPRSALKDGSHGGQYISATLPDGHSFRNVQDNGRATQNIIQ